MSIKEEMPEVKQKSNTYEENVSSRRKNISSTLRFAWNHPDDWWGSVAIREFPNRVEDLLQQGDSEEESQVLNQILRRGSLEGVKFDTPYPRKTGGWNHDWPFSGLYEADANAVCRRRLAITQIFQQDPDLTRHFVQQRTFGFHVTGSCALESILQRGLMSRQELESRGIPITTGEQADWSSGIRSIVSVAEWDLAFDRVLERYGRILGGGSSSGV